MKLSRWMAVVILVAIASVDGYAQTDQGKVSGTIRDMSGAFAAGAKVTVKNERTGEERNGMSNDQGYFVISYLKPSTYTIRAEKSGFAGIEYTAMPLAVGQELTLDFEIKPAGVEENVTVVGTAPVLDISSARICRLPDRRTPGPGPGRTSGSRGARSNRTRFDMTASRVPPSSMRHRAT
jgi:hypothetical protein